MNSDTKRSGFSAALVAIASLATFLSNMSAGIVNVPIAEITRGLGGGDYALVAILLSYLVPYAVVMPVIGKLGDRYGHKRVFLWGLGLYAVTSLFAAFSPDPAVLVALRTLQGLGGGIILVSIVFISTQIRDSQGLAFGIWRAALLAGTVAGPVIGGYLDLALGWRSLFWLMAPFAGALWLWAAFALEELPRREERFDWVGSLIFLVGFSAFVVALAVSGMDTMQAGLSTAIGKTMGAMALMLYGVFAVAMVLLWINQKTEKKPLFDASLYRIRPFVLGNLGTWLVCVGMFSAMMFVPLELRYVTGYSELEATNSLLPLTVTAIVVGVWGGQITDRLGAALPWAAGFLVMAAGFVALAVLGPAAPAPLLFAIMTATGFGMALPLAPTAVVALTTVPEEAAGEAAGLFNFAHNMGRAMGLGMLGALLVLTAAASYSVIFSITAAMMAAAAALTLGLPARRDAPREPAG
jgi:DHA2 family methylenomycin A resistance protein-like MFS transporter